MASTRKSLYVDLPGRVGEQLGRSLAPGANLLLGLSGGVDSVVLLHILRALAPKLRFSVRALHVNHGLSSNAAAWGAFCERLCATLAVPFAMESVDIVPYRALGVEGAARQARHEALARHAGEFTDFIVLAQHRDDQAETLLLQLARGAGARGLAGMPVNREIRGSAARLLRPMLGATRRQIMDWARQKNLEWVEDESNDDLSLKRNFIRGEVLPLLERGFPGASAAIARSAGLLGGASILLDRMADEDIADVSVSHGVRVSELKALGDARARNVLRRWSERRGAPWPGLPRINELLRQLAEARSDALINVGVQGWSFRRYRGVLLIEPPVQVRDADFVEHWDGEPVLPLMELGGLLRFKPEQGRGLSASKLRNAPVTVRLRRGGERLQLHANSHHRTLKNLFQERAVPPWLRPRWPLLYSGDILAAIPGLAESVELKAAPEEPGLIVSWERFDEDGNELQTAIT